MNDNKIIDGKVIALRIKEEVKHSSQILRSKGIAPKLVVVLVGEDPASQIYVNTKHKTCLECGIESEKVLLPQTATQDEVLQVIDRLNKDISVHGILVQLPLPKHINVQSVINQINPAKDVDGFHPLNAGSLFLGNFNYETSLLPCTPKGCMMLLQQAIPHGIVGLNAIVIGSSNIVGKPMAAMLMQQKATVTICNSSTKNLTQFCKNADIIITATGVVNILKANMLKQGVVIIDVGINRITKDGKNIIVGDCDYQSCYPIASKITPVPGGVGPMTIACLMQNTLIAASNA